MSLPVARYDAVGASRGGVILLDPSAWGGGAEPPRNAPPCVVDLVAAGFTVVVPDLAWRQAPPPDADTLADALADHEVIADVSAARAQLPPGARFVIGVGRGGVYARLAACAVLGLDGAVGFGGRIWYSGVSAQRPIQPLDLLPGLGCALQCHFDESDPDAPPAQVDELERRLATVSRPWQLFRYPPGQAAAGWRGAASVLPWARARTFLLHLAADRS